MWNVADWLVAGSVLVLAIAVWALTRKVRK